MGAALAALLFPFILKLIGMSINVQEKTEKAASTRQVEAPAPVTTLSFKDKLLQFLPRIGLGGLNPWVLLLSGEQPRQQLGTIWHQALIPLLASVFFIFLWDLGARSAESDLGKIPRPVEVWEQVGVLWADHVGERAKETEFYDRIKTNFPEQVGKISYTGKPTFIDQIFTSLKTVFAGFLLAGLLALPIGIAMGLYPGIRRAINPVIQIFKPVSPVVWLLLVTMVVSATLSSNEVLGMPKSFIISFISVSLCAMWPTLVNTSVGVSSVDNDYINVARVLQLNVFSKVFKVVLPASLPMVFTGLRVSVSIAWMVLIAIELLAQSPGLGKFVWDEFQNGSSASNAKIIVAAFVIGIIGFVLDRMMIRLQKMVTYNAVEVV